MDALNTSLINILKNNNINKNDSEKNINSYYNGTSAPQVDDSKKDYEDEYEYSDRVIYLNYVNKKCWQYIPPILLLIGLVGNTLSILVMRRLVSFTAIYST